MNRKKARIAARRSFIQALLWQGILLLTSCATVLNRPTKTVNIITTLPARVVLNKDTLPNYHNRSQAVVYRQKKEVQLKVIGDSLSKIVKVQPRNSFAYWLNAYPVPMFWTGFLIDKHQPKRYSYPNRIYVDMADPADHPLKFDPRNQKGNVYLQVSLPHINSFLLKPDHEQDYKASLGFWGFTLGLDYYHSPRQFVSISASAVSDFFLPVPAAVDMSGEYELMTSGYVALSNNHRIHRFSLGYGISLARNGWGLYYEDWGDPAPSTREPVILSNNALGLIFPVSYQMGEHFFVGTVYRPTLFRLSSVSPVKYEHLISLELGWRIRLNNKFGR